MARPPELSSGPGGRQGTRHGLRPLGEVPPRGRRRVVGKRGIDKVGEFMIEGREKKGVLLCSVPDVPPETHRRTLSGRLFKTRQTPRFRVIEVSCKIDETRPPCPCPPHARSSVTCTPSGLEVVREGGWGWSRTFVKRERSRRTLNE